MSQGNRYFVTGIDTDSGKTIVSAVLTEKLKADYWKPVQAGRPTDSDTIKSLISEELIVHPEGVILEAPMSPHAAAELEEIKILSDNFMVPETKNTLIIEGAGGLMVPINNQEMVIELAKRFKTKVILVSRNYLGSINHTLLSAKHLLNEGYDVAGIIFNDEPNQASEEIILSYTGIRCLGHLGKLDDITIETIKCLGEKIDIS